MIRKYLLAFSSLAMAVALGATGSLANAQGAQTSNEFWWPEKLNLSPLRQNSPESNPLGADFDYAEAAIELAEAIATICATEQLAR